MNLISLVLSLAASFFVDNTAEIVFAGDAMQHDQQLKAAHHADGTYSFHGSYCAIEPYVSSADLAVVNLELPLGGAPYTGYPMFCAPDSFLYELKNAGFDYVLTANNHSLDRRDKGLERTLDVIDRAGLGHTGTFRNAAERDSLTPSIVNVNGIKVAFLNYTYGTNGVRIQKDAVVNTIDRDRISRDIGKARAAGAEIVAVCMHWGVEYVLLPNREQKSLADFLEEEGADLIIGGHPHVIQPMEMRRSEENGNKVLVVYSLGNFISAMKDDDCVGGAMVRVRLRRDRAGRALVDSASYRLVVVHPPAGSGEIYRVIPAEGNLPENIRPSGTRFYDRATDIFDKYNLNVPLDTLPISAYNKKGWTDRG